jgi:carboxylesterase
MLPWLVPFAAAAVGRVFHAHAMRVADRAYLDRFPAGASGIVAGAEGFTLHGTTGRGLLLLHGSGDTPQTLRHLAGRLHEAGYTVHAPLLPGHGRAPSAFMAVTAEEYMDASRAAIARLRGDSESVEVIGLSMGGALAARLAAESPEVRTLALLAPYLDPPAHVRAAAAGSWLWGLVLPSLPGQGERSVHDPVARDESRAYGVFPPRALRALVSTADAGRAALSSVAVPTLVVNSREDNRIPLDVAERVTAALRAPTERHWVTGCGHIITVDYCRETVAKLVLDFLARHAP